MESSQKILEAARTLGMRSKIHADEFHNVEAASLAADIHAVSADHLLKASQDGLRRMAERNVIGCLLPGTPFVLSGSSKNNYAQARWMIDNNVPIALATDYNALCPLKSMQAAISLAVFEMRMLPSECISASTINGAFAIAREKEIGSLEQNKKADLLICDTPDHRDIGFSFGTNVVETVIKRVKLSWKKGN